jgi:hypothetical protein
MEGGFIRESQAAVEPLKERITGTTRGHPAASVPNRGATPSSGCTRCRSLSYSQEWLDAFGVVMCDRCKRDEKLVSKVRRQRGDYRARWSVRLAGYFTLDNTVNLFKST